MLSSYAGESRPNLATRDRPFPRHTGHRQASSELEQGAIGARGGDAARRRDWINVAACAQDNKARTTNAREEPTRTRLTQQQALALAASEDHAYTLARAVVADDQNLMPKGVLLLLRKRTAVFDATTMDSNMGRLHVVDRCES